MHNTLTICKKELGSYFNSPVAYVVITALLGISGGLFFAQAFEVKETSLRGLFATAPLIFLFIVPAIPARLLAEEKRSGTIALLITMPIKDWEVVLGKYLAALGVLATAVALMFVYAFTIDHYGDLDWGSTLTGYLGLLLMGGAYLAIGLMASSWTKSQVVAFIVAVAICFALFLVGKLLPLLPTSLAPVLGYISLDAHFVNIARGVIDTRDLVYYVSLIGCCLFLAVQSLDSRRWR